MKCRVRFLPDDVEVEVERGETILRAAERAGVYVNSICGGEGLCGKCRVIVKEGDVRSRPTALLSREEIRKGYCLACLTEVLSDLIVEVPVESRLEGRPVLVGEEAVRFGRISPKLVPYKHDPLSKKVFLELPPPSLEDNLSDLDRIYRGLAGKGYSYPVMQTGLFNLKRLARLLRESDWKVTVTLGRRGGTVELVQFEPGDTSRDNYGVAVDIGTTTIAAHLVDLNTGRTLGTQARYNSQIKYGEDVISRIIYADNEEDGLSKLHGSVVKDINDLIGALVEEADVHLHDVTYLMCAGNTTMIHFLLEMDPSNIRREPYIPTANSVPVIRAAEVGIAINGRGLLGCVPGVGSYVGGDITAGILASGMHRREELSLYIDMGTNGEVVLGNKDWLICCSASAGPAFEGGGIRCGMRATEGAIEKMVITEDGRAIWKVIGKGKPRGICGSGLIDAVAEMLKAGVINRSGKIERDGRWNVREGEDGYEVVLVPAEETGTGRDIVITEADLATFIRSKGAIYAAANTLMSHLGFSFEDLDTVYISGGFGNYLDVQNAILIGLLPDLPPGKFKFIGNGSITGAEMCLLSEEALGEVEELARKMTYFELSTDPKFMDEFSLALFLPHTNLEKFPSAVALLERRR